jgi:tetratricopeptide (TPR) repeat protein
MIGEYLTTLLHLGLIAAIASVFILFFFRGIDEEKLAKEIESFAKGQKFNKIPRKLLFVRSDRKKRILSLALLESASHNHLHPSIILQAFGADFQVKGGNQLDSLQIALKNKFWDIATSLISNSHKDISFEYLNELFLNAYNSDETKEALVLFMSANIPMRKKFIATHFGKLMTLSRNHNEYFNDGFKIAKERIPLSAYDQIERNGFLALHWTKIEQPVNGFALLFPFLKSEDPEIKEYAFLVYYFLGLCYYKAEHYSEAMRAFEEVNKRKPHYHQTDHYIHAIKEKIFNHSSHHHKDSKVYENVDLKNYYHYEILGITPAATKEEIKKAYHKQITLFHPDKFVMMNKTDQLMANEKSKKINEAYSQCLKALR